MRCEQAVIYISAQLDGELDNAESDQLAAHIRSCPDCAYLAQNFEQLSKLLKCAEARSPSEAFRSELMARLLQKVIDENKSYSIALANRTWTVGINPVAFLAVADRSKAVLTYSEHVHGIHLA